MQKPNPILIVDRFPDLLTALLDLLGGLSPEDWERTATPQGWTVKDVALHLLGDDLGLLSGRRDGFSGIRKPIHNWEELVGWINVRNQAWVEATRRISPRLLCDLLEFSGKQVNAYFLTLDLQAEGPAVSWAGPAPCPVWLDVAREFTERWHHQQHVRDAVGKPGLTQPYYLAPVLGAFIHALPQTYRRVAAPVGACVTLTISGESGGVWSVLREQDGWRLYAGKPPQPTAEVALPDVAAWRLFTRGMSVEAARKQAILYGDSELALQMLETVAIIA